VVSTLCSLTINDIGLKSLEGIFLVWGANWKLRQAVMLSKQENDALCVFVIPFEEKQPKCTDIYKDIEKACTAKFLVS
jgi:hypothetical protein